MKETKERKMIRHKKKNVRIFPIYKTVSWDLLFYFPIIFLFLTQVKGFSASQVLFADAFYTLANTFWQLPITSLVDRIGKKNCLIIGNVLYSASILAMIFMQNYYELLLIQFIYALGYSIKGICESNILYDSLPASKKRGRVFATIDGKSSSYFYIFDAISSVIAGFTFAINGYIPMVLCFLCCVASTIISFRFRHTAIVEDKVKPVSLKEYIGQIKESMKGLPDNMGEEVARFLTEVNFGDFYTREGLDIKTRELLVISILVTTNNTATLKSHIKGNLKAGNSKETITAAIIQCLPYVGFPNTLNALRTMKEVLNEQ